MSRLRHDPDGTVAWHNWTGDQVCVPASLHRPQTVGELAAVVADVAAAGGRAKVVGSGHSFTSVAMTGGALIDIGALNRIVDVDVEAGLVRVEAGMVLADLNAALHRHGLALPNLGDIDRQTVAGAIQTGTHGTGVAHRNISHQVEAVELVTGSGEVIEIDRGDDLLAARVGIGALGALTAVTLRCVPAFRLHRRDVPVPLDDVLDGLEDLAAGHDHFEFFVFPHGDTALTVSRDRTHAALAPRGRVEEYVNEELLQNRLGDLILKLTRAKPSLTRSFGRLATRLLSEGEYVDHSHRIFSSRRNVRFTEMEYAIPRTHASEAVRRVLDIIERGVVTAMPVECRVLAGDPALLSPSHERDSAYIAAHQYEGMAWEAYFRQVETVMADYDGRPHWGKRHHLDASTLRRLYPRFGDFLAVRDRLDPERVFGNAYTDTVLGD